MRFEWDEDKNVINKRKHGVAFEEAQTVFLDANALIIDDVFHSSDEERFLIIGLSVKLNALTVCHCYRGSDSIRMISARKATKREVSQYEKGGL